jgi:predicted DNA binding CopG/RHH family protein
VLIFEKGENETEKSNQWINVEKEFNRMNMDKTVTMRISKNLDTVIRIKVNAQWLNM